jgi:hypothetical protein
MTVHSEILRHDDIEKRDGKIKVDTETDSKKRFEQIKYI